MFTAFIGKLRLDWKITLIVVISTLMLILDAYHLKLFPWEKLFPFWEPMGFQTKILDRTLLYFVIPMLIILFVFREKPGEYGFALGDWKAGFLITLAAIIILIPILWLVSKWNLALHDYYRTQLAGFPWNTLLDLAGWEFFFRGWLLFGFSRKFGPEAIWLQAIPFALAHIGKPEIETLSTIFGGFAFGWVAWRTRSFLYPLLIHWFVSSFIIVLSSGIPS